MKTSNNQLPICLIYVITLAIFLTVSFNGMAQNVGINNPTPHAKALLDLTSSDKGMLAPRLTQAQRIAMFPAPDATAAGMLVYQTDQVIGFYYFDGVNWNMVSDGKAGWSLTGNANTDSTVNFIGTTDNQPWIIKTNNTEAARVMTNGNTGIGTPSPVQKLHVAGNVNLSNDTNNIRINDIRVLSVKGNGNLFTGENAGINNTGTLNSFIGDSSGVTNTSGYANTAVGKNTMRSNTTGNWNTATGVNSLEKNTTGFSNTAIGIAALTDNTTGFRNTAVGAGSLQKNTTGIQNTAIGHQSSLENTTGNYNTALGGNAFQNNTSGSNNVAVGHTALAANSTASNNTAIGTNAGISTTTGSYNFFGGTQSGNDNTTGENNSFVGYRSGMHTTIGNLNSAFGSNAFLTNTVGIQNTAMGSNALFGNTNGSWNTGIGSYSLAGNTIGIYNTAIGIGSGTDNTSGSYNSFLGPDAGRRNTTGNSNVFVGFESGYMNTTSSENVFVGLRSGRSNTSGAFNTFLGTNNGYTNTTGFRNTSVGANAYYSGTTGSQNIAIGDNAMNKNTTGSWNTAVGSHAMMENVTGFYNTTIGIAAGMVNTIGNWNTFIGSDAGRLNTEGHSNVFIGFEAGFNNTTMSDNTFIGTRAGRANTSGSMNTFVGFNSGMMNTTGYNNAFYGRESGRDNTTGFENSFIGNYAGWKNTTGSDNTFVGRDAGLMNTTGSSNTIVGELSGRNNNGSSNTLIGQNAGFLNSTGNNNVFIGQNSGVANATGSNNIAIGINTSVGATLTNASAIGANASTILSNSMALGVPGTNVGIGINEPRFPLSFGNAFGDKVALWGLSGPTCGFGVQPNLLQIHSGNSWEDIGFGYGTSAAFTETMRIKGNGNVGIGTTNPEFPLSFNNNHGDKISLWGTAGNTYGFGIQANTLQIHSGTVVDDIAFGYGPSASFVETMRIKGNGNVGIGTSNSLYRLQLVDDFIPLAVQSNVANGYSGMHYLNNTGSIMGHMGYGNPSNPVFADRVYAGSTTAIPFVLTTNNAERIRIEGNGNVGIGTATPTYRLQVVNDGNIPFAVQSNIATGYSGMHFLNNSGTAMGHMGYGNPSNAVFPDRMYVGTTTTVPVVMTTNNAERMRIDAAGNVGIGTSTPTTELEVNGFTKLGTDAPAIKTKKLTASTPALQTSAINIPHLIPNHTKILSVDIFIENSLGNSVAPGYTAAGGHEYNFYISPTNIVINLINGNASQLINNRPVRVLVTYEE